jgi:hypothetical protein
LIVSADSLGFRCTHQQASLGFLLPTLLAWRMQLRAAKRFVVREEAAGRGSAAQAELLKSAYICLCAPVLRIAKRFGYLASTCAAALGGFIAAVAVQLIQAPR